MNYCKSTNLEKKISVTLKNVLYFKLYLHIDFDVSTDINSLNVPRIHYFIIIEFNIYFRGSSLDVLTLVSVRRPLNTLTFHDHTGHTSWKYMYKNIKIMINCILRLNIWSIWVHICTEIQDPMTRAISGLPPTSNIHSLVTLCL